MARLHTTDTQAWAAVRRAAEQKMFTFQINPSLLVMRAQHQDDTKCFVGLLIPTTKDPGLDSFPVFDKRAHITCFYDLEFMKRHWDEAEHLLWQRWWAFKHKAVALLTPRFVTMFLTTSTGRRFNLDPACELYSLVLQIRQVAFDHGLSEATNLSDDEFQFHISWL
jgi:hypothetical protein